MTLSITILSTMKRKMIVESPNVECCYAIVIILYAVILKVIILTVVLVLLCCVWFCWVSLCCVSFCFYHYAVCRSVEYHYAVCRSVEYHYAVCLPVKCRGCLSWVSIFRMSLLPTIVLLSVITPEKCISIVSLVVMNEWKETINGPKTSCNHNFHTLTNNPLVRVRECSVRSNFTIRFNIFGVELDIWMWFPWQVDSTDIGFTDIV
jgi:hypothetical protein